MGENVKHMTEKQRQAHYRHLGRMQRLRRKRRAEAMKDSLSEVRRIESEISKTQEAATAASRALGTLAVEHGAAVAQLRLEEKKQETERVRRLKERLQEVCAGLDKSHSVALERELFDLMAEARLLRACGASWERLHSSVEAIKLHTVRRTKQTFADLTHWVKIPTNGE